MSTDRYAPTVLYQDAALRIVQTWQVDCRCYQRTDAYRDHLFTAEACPDPTARRALVIERASDTDALGQPIWLPGGALQAAELLRLLESLTLQQLQALKGESAEVQQPRSMTCATCTHTALSHAEGSAGGPCWRGGCSCSAFCSETAAPPEPPADPTRCPECHLPVDPRKSAVTDEQLQPDGRWLKRLLHAQCWSTMQRVKDAASAALPVEVAP